MMVRPVLPLLLVLTVACGDKTPTGPSETPSGARLISLEGDLNFGNVDVGQEAVRPLRIRNTGSDTLTVTGMTGAVGDTFAASWTSGTIAAGGLQDVLIRFRPTESRHYLTTLIVNGNHTGGTNTTQMSGFGVRTGPLWTMSGKGNTVFDAPSFLTRVRIQGTWSRRNLSNFIVHLNGRTLVNEILRQSLTYDGVHLMAGGGVVEIVSSSEISWTFTEER